MNTTTYLIRRKVKQIRHFYRDRRIRMMEEIRQMLESPRSQQKLKIKHLQLIRTIAKTKEDRNCRFIHIKLIDWTVFF